MNFDEISEAKQAEADEMIDAYNAKEARDQMIYAASVYADLAAAAARLAASGLHAPAFEDYDQFTAQAKRLLETVYTTGAPV